MCILTYENSALKKKMVHGQASGKAARWRRTRNEHDSHVDSGGRIPGVRYTALFTLYTFEIFHNYILFK